jgi:hypothetical protein
MSFPIIENYDFSEIPSGQKENPKVKEALDWAVEQWKSRGDRNQRLDKLYNAFNGVVDQSEIDSIIKFTGRKSKTKYVKYRLGRSKLKLVHGEFLEIPITPTVHTVNRDAQNEKMNRYKKLYGMSLAKPYIEKTREMGYDVYPGVKIPDRENQDFWHINNFKLTNEMAMQAIIDDKMQTQKMKSKFFNNMVDLTIAAEMFGKVERNQDGVDIYREISPKNALFEESVYDPLCERTPYMGEVRKMYYHEILANPEFTLTADQKKRLKEIKDQYHHDTQISDGSIEMMNGQAVFPVYTIEWKGLEPVYLKITPAKGSNIPYKLKLSEEYYKKNKSQIDKDVKNGKYTLEVYYNEVLWSAHRISTDIYTVAEKEEFLIQRMDANGKFHAEFNYSGFLFGTVNGFRVSLQEIIHELEKIYDDIRFQINKEIKKARGSVLFFDEAFKPKGKRFIDLYHSIDEDGIVRFNSAAEGNESGMDMQGQNMFKTETLGSDAAMNALVLQAMEIERVMDRITGLNENRQGLTKATMTATANVNNIEASRSMTYDLFYFVADYIERVLMKLAEKTKTNITHHGMDSRMFIYDDKTIKHLVATKNLMLDNYGVTLTDGKREADVLRKVEMFFPQEINAGLLRTKDVIRFLSESSFSKALKVLDDANNELQAWQEKQQRIAQEGKDKETQTKLQIATEDREDQQAHDRDMEALRTEGKKEIEMLKGGIKGMQEATKQAEKEPEQTII